MVNYWYYDNFSQRTIYLILVIQISSDFGIIFFIDILGWGQKWKNYLFGGLVTVLAR
jgi:hypothetical protein